MPTFDDLTTVSKTLNEQSNEINQILSDFEKKLAGMNLGVEAWVGAWNTPGLFLDHIEYTENGGSREGAWVLGYAEDGRGQYRLMTKRLTGYFDAQEVWHSEEGEIRSILAASRKHRVKALELMESLLTALEQEAQRIVDAIKKGKKTVEKL